MNPQEGICPGCRELYYTHHGTEAFCPECQTDEDDNAEIILDLCDYLEDDDRSWAIDPF